MKVHLVAGFLGSGKTTAITNTSKLLIDKGFTASIITNDQGRFQVDSHFVKSLQIANAEVSGGCFCCNYNQLDEQIELLRNEVKPDLIFAESVGSCTDLVATVLKPLLNFKSAEIEKLTFTTFVDARLLLTFFRGNELPFEVYFKSLAKFGKVYVAIELFNADSLENEYANTQKSIDYLLKNF